MRGNGHEIGSAAFYQIEPHATFPKFTDKGYKPADGHVILVGASR
jgi:hypothetical protein